MFVSPEGETREIMLPFDMDNYELITNCWYTPDGRLLASQGGAIYEINQEDGSLTVLFETDGDADTACFSDTPVSYTHLDVYKRQVDGCDDFTFLIKIAIPLAKPILAVNVLLLSLIHI